MLRFYDCKPETITLNLLPTKVKKHLANFENSFTKLFAFDKDIS